MMPLRISKLSKFIFSNAAKTCEACGNEFKCGASLKGCWCAEIKLSEEARGQLKLRYEDCLCSSCLEQMQNPEVKKEICKPAVDRAAS